MVTKAVTADQRFSSDLPSVLGARAGALEVRLARSVREVEQAQALRYRVFYEEMSARPTAEMVRLCRDFDIFDACCDHLLVIDHTRPADRAVVGTYRLMRDQVAAIHSGFYSASEFDLSPLIEAHSAQQRGRRLLELGRSCVEADYRTTATIHLLWRGIVAYTAYHNVAYMFGCASLEGTDPAQNALALSFLHHEFQAPDDLQVRALAHRYVDMNMLAREDIDQRRALRALPPLIKGYLRMGCYIGDGAVIDEQFGSTDVFILLPVDRIASGKMSHLARGRPAGAVVRS